MNKNEWQPIETAPKDQRIILCYETCIFTNIFSACGKWNDDQYSNNPKPYWTHDMEKILGVRETRGQQPIAWMPLPEAPTK